MSLSHRVRRAVASLACRVCGHKPRKRVSRQSMRTLEIAMSAAGNTTMVMGLALPRFLNADYFVCPRCGDIEWRT